MKRPSDRATLDFAFMKDRPKKFPHVIDIGGVKKYLRDKGVPNVDDNPTTYPSVEQSFAWEEILRKDLDEARRSRDEDRRNHVRALLYGLTWELHGPPNRENLIRQTVELEQWIKHKASLRSAGGSSQDGEIEFIEDFKPVIIAIRNAVGSNSCGGAVEEAILGIERCLDLAWDDLGIPQGKRPSPQRELARKAIINFLRPLRDQIYYQFVDGTWCETAPKPKRATG